MQPMHSIVTSAWSQHHTRSLVTSAPCSSDAAKGGAGSDGAAPAGSSDQQPVRMSLGEALTKLVDAAVELVEKGDTQGAIGVLKEGIDTFSPQFPDSPEVGELHNQVAVLSLSEGDTATAAQHAEVSLASATKHFGPTSPLTAHRQLRLGVARFANGAVAEAAGLLQTAVGTLQKAKDPSASEAGLYLDMCLLAGATDASQVRSLDERLLGSARDMARTFGGQSMILSMALAQHDRVVHQPLAAADPDPLLCEALLRQHAKLLEAVVPESEDLAVTNYKLATFYYVQDMLQEANGAIRAAAQGLRAVYPEEHDLVVLCKHRLGMISAAAGDHRAGAQLLAQSHARYTADAQAAAGGKGPGQSGLALEADVGLAMCRYRGLPPSATDADRQSVLGEAHKAIDTLAAAIGVNHMLARGAMRHFARLSATLKPGSRGGR